MIKDELATTNATLDVDPIETQEWLTSFDAMVQQHGHERARFILTRLLRQAQDGEIPLPALVQTPYLNTIPAAAEPAYPGDEAIERRIRRYIRWNAVAMVLHANERDGLGGHLSTYASAATLYEVGFNHFFRGADDGPGDMVYFQGHASPGIYARAFLERRLTEDHLRKFRREVAGGGLSSYPHPTLMPDFWQFPTVSMGLGPLSAIYQARFNRYLHHRGLADSSKSRVWCFVGDGECDEPETLGALHLASREKLSNLVFVINCNLQRLDGPVRGNGKIIQELEAVFNGSGWRVIKAIWGREWDKLLAADHEGVLADRMGQTVDGQYQKYSVESGAYIREQFFGPDPRLQALVADRTDAELARLRRGGQDLRKVYAAYHAAAGETERPTVILAKTVKGWTLGQGIEGRNVTHQQKKMTIKELAVFRDLLNLDISDSQLLDPPFIRFPKKSEEFEYLMERRQALGGFLPARKQVALRRSVPEVGFFERYLKGSGDQDVSTTAAFARMLGQLLAHRELGPWIVPIVPDEARTFGMDALFRQYGIYSSVGQLYEPVDAHMLMSYREAKDGQMLEEGICEAGSMASFIAAGSAYATFDKPLLPFYIYYSMFGFQRVGDQIWAAGDQRCRGFLLGATAGRTTLRGEGLQHCDGHSPLMAAAYPHVVHYDPAWAYEVAVLLQHGLKRMLEQEERVIFYLTLQNEGYPMPPMPEGVTQGIIDGIYCYRRGSGEGPRVQLLGSGSILCEALRAQELLSEQFGVVADVWSVTSYVNLQREALACERHNLLHPLEAPRVPLITRTLQGSEGPVIAVSDYVRALPDLVSRWIPGGLFTLGTDGFGRSDTRPALRRYFGIDAEYTALAALKRLAEGGTIDNQRVAEAVAKLGIDATQPDAATYLP
ncbi:MAG: pyruvate dehydrogenase (acetyl-transferring), homodimeric type [Proteobacteria bacterium]|nr:pyruvate dehydrogenase (acetyl-transferring), homodimeric type [Pseudomonadota bacterium]